jgi:bifunctional UDP-N-acetylglucosamine pyrophosphorylase/glucosamine-1-phosphate N-acetyltransferase
MLHWLIEAVRPLCDQLVVVLGHGREQVLATLDADIAHAVQDPPQGTGDALRVAGEHVIRPGVLLVLPGDAPLITQSTLARLLEGHGSALCSVLTARISSSEAATSGYGRILRDDSGTALAIVEAANATAAQRQITEVNTGVYAFDAQWLFDEVLPNLPAHPPKNEYYLTDAIQHAAEAGRLKAIEHDNLTEVTGVNDPIALAELESAARAQINRAWMEKGVHFVDPTCTYIDADVQLNQDVKLGPGVVLRGKTTVGPGAEIGAYSVLEDCIVGAEATVHAHCVCTGATLETGSSAGPFARLREGTHLGENAQVGNFVEVKETRLGAGAKANHLSYLGNAELGPNVNVGAGTITCNYDGHAKHKTTIGEGAFIGSNSALVAPVSVGAGAIVAAGSTLTEDVPENALSIARSPQKNIDSAATRIHAKKAEEAKRAKD